ncbi:MAG TPA: IclR family transcriptional regulator [Burkholderiales bacterium]|nr:IclR family transcriptional regulator [Burkholderiales bacterium]
MNAPLSRYNVPGLERGLRMLQLFDRTRKVLPAAEMARTLGIPRSTAFRIAQTLEFLGFLEREGDSYRVGPAVLRLGFEYIASLEVAELARPLIERLRDATSLSAQLVIRDGREVVVVVKASPPSTFASNVTVGTRLPAHATILGRVLLSDADDRTLQALYPDAALPQQSSRAPHTLADLKRLLREDRARGYAVSESFFEQGISAVAAPVRDRIGAIVAAISVTAQRPTLEPREFRDRLVEQVLGAAAELSRSLNYRPAEVAA